MSFDSADILEEFAAASGMGRWLALTRVLERDCFRVGGWADRRAVKTAWMRDWRLRNLDAARAKERARYATLKADPEKYAAFCERHLAAIKRYRAKPEVKKRLAEQQRRRYWARKAGAA